MDEESEAELFDRRKEDLNLVALIKEVVEYKAKVEELDRTVINRLLPIESKIDEATILMAKIAGVETGRTQKLTIVSGIGGYLIGKFQDVIVETIKKVL